MTFDPMDQGIDAEEAHDRVADTIADHEVVLFMKGDARMPQCGYSKRAFGLISQYRSDVATVDTLKNLEAFREALEAESGWETIPQTFVDGEFVGGSDILAELEERGDLAETLNADGPVANGDAESAEGPDAPF
ncbi:glutaredoxin family protein [Halobaculum limi]|uniref:glutaredoxin family protein n=1 Tax=Halobaculum limi TaxID=3031916 RepID=UPI0024075BEF|nr:glutaredoxin domain-containing protein [Halobaculum sp. YSMS11]